MSVTIDTLRIHLDYTAWATGRLLDASAKLTDEEMTRDFGTADRCVRDTLAHIFAADRVWLTRVQGQPPATFLSAEEKNFEMLKTEWPALLERWKAWLAPLTDADAGAKIAYKDLRGNAYQQPLWQILLHVVNHGSHHRGQVAGFLRAMGHTPPLLDLIAYYRSLS